MKKFDVSTDSTADVTIDEINALNIHHVPLTYTLEQGKDIAEYLDNFTKPEQYSDFFNQLRNGVVAKTAMLNYVAHFEHFTKMAQNGVKDCIHFSISYSLSKTTDLAKQAAADVKAEYPDFNCYCVEANSATIGQGALTFISCDLRDKGKTVQEAYEFIEQIKHNLQHYIVVDSLMYLKRGGRVTSIKAVLGSMLDIKPILTFSKTGKLEFYKKERGTKKALKTIVDEFDKNTLHKTYNTVYIVHSDNLPLALDLEKQLKEKYNVKTNIRAMGPIIGAHVGPNSVAYGFVSNEHRPV